MPTSPHVLFACGGSPSHLNPGLSVAEQLGRRLPGAGITFAGPSNVEHRHQVRTAGYEYLSIPARPTPKSTLQAIRFVTDNLAGYCSARWLLREHRVSLVVGLGGYGSTSLLRAAATRGTPYVLLEQNATPGPATRWFSRNSELVCVACEETKPHLEIQTPVLCAGNPASPRFEDHHRNSQHRAIRMDQCLEQFNQTYKKRLVVLGGVGNSKILNRAVPNALKQLGSVADDWQVIHQTGGGQLLETERRYQAAEIDALAVTYVDELASVLFSSDLVICRAGGTTLAELALAGVPALLVPLSDDDPSGSQMANAKVFCAAGASRMLEESENLSVFTDALGTELKQVLCSESLREELRSNIKRLARPGASAEIAEAICETIYGRSSENLLAA